jgi:hypothetical protein
MLVSYDIDVSKIITWNSLSAKKAQVSLRFSGRPPKPIGLLSQSVDRPAADVTFIGYLQSIRPVTNGDTVRSIVFGQYG